MSRGATYFGLLAALRQDELLYDVRRQNRPTEAIRPRRRRRSFGAQLMRRLRRRRR